MIKKGSDVTFAYRIFSGEEFEELMDETLPGQPMTYTQGEGCLIPGLEKAMEGLKEGDTAEIIVRPEDGYGMPLDEMIVRVPRDQVPKEAEIREGLRVPGTSPEGEMCVGYVIKVDDESVTIDFNHELAGRTLKFEVEVIKVSNK